MIPIKVTCAVIRRNQLTLAAQRHSHHHNSNLWEFPGGKLLPGETPEACIIREIQEELGVSIQIITPLTPVEFSYPEKIIRLIPFLAEICIGEPKALDHQEIGWFSAHELKKLQWSPADVPILKEFLKKHF
jgi:8-oxo-dGTP diphosphatase